MPRIAEYEEIRSGWLRYGQKRWCQDVAGLVLASLLACVALIWLGRRLAVTASATEISGAFLVGALTTFAVTKLWGKVRSDDR